MRPIITHCQVMGEDLIERMREQNAIANIQPQFVSSDALWVEERLDRKLIPYSYAWRTLLRSRVRVTNLFFF